MKSIYKLALLLCRGVQYQSKKRELRVANVIEFWQERAENNAVRGGEGKLGEKNATKKQLWNRK